MNRSKVGRRRLCILGFAALASATSVRAAPQPAAIFASHAILQRDRPLTVWGKAEPAEKVDVAFADQTASDVADSQGRWSVRLKPLPASATPRTMTIAGTIAGGGGKTVTLDDVLVGDVWLCSGQSNMAFALSQADNGKETIAAATDPLLRQYRVKNALSREPARDATGYWTVGSPQTVGQFTAVGYFFARARSGARSACRSRS